MFPVVVLLPLLETVLPLPILWRPLISYYQRGSPTPHAWSISHWWTTLSWLNALQKKVDSKSKGEELDCLLTSPFQIWSLPMYLWKNLQETKGAGVWWGLARRTEIQLKEFTGFLATTVGSRELLQREVTMDWGKMEQLSHHMEARHKAAAKSQQLKKMEDHPALKIEQEATQKQGKQKNQRWKMETFRIVLLSNRNINASHK